MAYPYNLSFRALTILIEHIENQEDFPIIVHDSLRRQCTRSLIERGYLRMKNSRTTTITRIGREKFREAAAAWAEFLIRANNQIQAEAA